jgi:hypothetical protein
MPWGQPWGQRWGARRRWHVDDQGYEWGATPDCVFLGKSSTGVLAELAIDRSQRKTNITVAASPTRLAGESSTRWRQNNGRTIECHCVISSTETGTRGIWNGGNGGEVWYLSNNTIVATYWNGSATSSSSHSTSLTLPTLATGANEFLFSWSTELNPNPDPSGKPAQTLAAQWNKWRSEMRAWNLTTGEFAQVVWTHADITQSGGSTAGTWLRVNNNDLFQGTVKALRLCKVFHSATETYRTWCTVGAKPETAGESRLEPPMPTRDSGIGDDGQYAGPVYAMAAAHARQQGLRLWTPIINENYPASTAPIHSTPDVGEGPDETMLQDPNDTDWYLQFPFVRRRPLPPNCNRLRVRICLHVEMDTPGTLGVRCYSMTQPGWTNRPISSPSQMVRYYRETSIDIDADNDDSYQWLEFDLLRPARDNVGWTYLALAFLSSGTGEEMHWSVRSWVVEPVLSTDESTAAVGAGSLG